MEESSCTSCMINDSSSRSQRSFPIHLESTPCCRQALECLLRKLFKIVHTTDVWVWCACLRSYFAPQKCRPSSQSRRPWKIKLCGFHQRSSESSSVLLISAPNASSLKVLAWYSFHSIYRSPEDNFVSWNDSEILRATWLMSSFSYDCRKLHKWLWKSLTLQSSQIAHFCQVLYVYQETQRASLHHSANPPVETLHSLRIYFCLEFWSQTHHYRHFGEFYQ